MRTALYPLESRSSLIMSTEITCQHRSGTLLGISFPTFCIGKVFIWLCQGTSETGNVSRPSAHGTPMDLQNGRSRGRIPAECLEQKMLYAYTTVCTQGGFTLSRK